MAAALALEQLRWVLHPGHVLHAPTALARRRRLAPWKRARALGQVLDELLELEDRLLIAATGRRPNAAQHPAASPVDERPVVQGNLRRRLAGSQPLCL
jgi:hypothetical protein